MNVLNISNYNLKKTLLGGQSFSWVYIDNTYWGVIQNTVVKLKEEDDAWHWQTYPENDNQKLIEKYFRIDSPYSEILEKIQNMKNFDLDKKEVAQGIVPNPDFINNRNIYITVISFV